MSYAFLLAFCLFSFSLDPGACGYFLLKAKTVVQAQIIYVLFARSILISDNFIVSMTWIYICNGK